MVFVEDIGRVYYKFIVDFYDKQYEANENCIGDGSGCHVRCLQRATEIQ